MKKRKPRKPIRLSDEYHEKARLKLERDAARRDHFHAVCLITWLADFLKENIGYGMPGYWIGLSLKYDYMRRANDAAKLLRSDPATRHWAPSKRGAKR